MRFTFRLALGLSVALSASAAFGQAASPVSLVVQPEADSWRWRVGLRNTSSAMVPLVFDRRLVWFEVMPPAPPPGTRVRRAPRPVRCVHEARPTNNERSPEVFVPGGESYSELVDVRDLCRLRMPAGFVEGASITVHYGFTNPTTTARRSRVVRRVPINRSIVRDERPEAVSDLTATVTVPALPVVPVVTTAPSPVLSGLNVFARGGSASEGTGLRATVTLQNPSIQPTWTLYRTTLFSFEVVTPSGTTVPCNAITRSPGMQREFFIRLGARGRRATTLVPHFYCPGRTFDSAGIYTATAIFETTADGSIFHFGRVFTGSARSTPFSLRVVRGRGPYAPVGASHESL